MLCAVEQSQSFDGSARASEVVLETSEAEELKRTSELRRFVTGASGATAGAAAGAAAGADASHVANAGAERGERGGGAIGAQIADRGEESNSLDIHFLAEHHFKVKDLTEASASHEESCNSQELLAKYQEVQALGSDTVTAVAKSTLDK